jgi:D-3-phosphoglycerate dehydrogenase
MLIMGLSRGIMEADRAVRNGDFQFRERFYPTEINSKVLFILGLGRIGSEVARKCRLSFNMNVLAYDPYVADFEMAAIGVNKVDLQTGLKSADFVSIHMALTSETQHMIGEKELSLMKPTAFLINVSRGGVINQKDLVRALKAKSIAGAGLDVFDPEPPQLGDALLELPNVILSPHFAGDTYEAKQNCSKSISTEVLAALKGLRPKFVVNPEVLGK